MFKQEQCDLCGDCLAKCQWIDADKEQAERLAVQEPAFFMMARSTSPVSAILDPRSEPSDTEAIEQPLFRKNY